MKKLIILIMLLVLTSCKSVGVKVTDPNNADWDISYFIWGKSNLQDVEASVGDVRFKLGSSSVDTPTGVSPQQLMCIVYGKCGQPEQQ